MGEYEFLNQEMTNIQSKIVTCSCQEFVHPWTDSCVKSVAGFLIQGSMHSVKIYSAVYAISLLMRKKVPSTDEMKRTLLGLIQSTAFLTANGAFFIGFMCLWKQMFGYWTFLGATFWPAFYASALAFLIERPARRILLTMYVTNEASETLWNLLERQGYVSSIKNGQVALFAVGVTMLLYLYKLGLHKQTTYKDPIFDIFNMLLGKKEGGPILNAQNINNEKRSTPTSVNGNMNLRAYINFKRKLQSKHEACNHEKSCISYTFVGGLKPLVAGITISATLKLITLIRAGQLKFNNLFLRKEVYNLGIFLGGFSFLYKGTSCLMRHLNGNDKPEYVIVSGLVASCAAFKFKNKFVSLYVTLKAIQLFYYWAQENNIMPNIPNFQILLYSTATAILFHSALYQPTSLRPSYWRFLFNLSGSRVALFNRHFLENFGMKSYESLQQALKQTRTMGKPLLWPMA